MTSIPSSDSPIQLSFDSPHLCECGCGQPTPIATHTNSSRGVVKGQPSRFIPRHCLRKDLHTRFWAKIVKTNNPGECWGWAGATTVYGYGKIFRQGQLLGAHRVAYELLVGPIPDGLVVMHICDNPPCCNPRHLRLGTKRDNTQDMIAKGRNRAVLPEYHPCGEKSPTAKLTDAKVRDIRRLVSEGHDVHALARRFGVHRSTIRLIISGKSWKHIE